MIEIREYKSGDEKLFESVEPDLSFHPDYQKMWDSVVKPDSTWTAFEDGRTIGVGGILIEDDKPMIWMKANRNISKKTLLRTIRIMFRLFESFRFNLLYACTQDCFDKGYKLLNWLGFQKIRSKPYGYSLYKKDY